jgi:diamine N-acetyltransferase
MSSVSYMSIYTTARNGKPIEIRQVNPADFDHLLHYLNQLSQATRNRFGPHPFEKEAIAEIFSPLNNHVGYIACDNSTGDIVAYSIVKIGYIDSDGQRLRSYGLTPDPATDATFAPSVADAWQSFGIGNLLFEFVLTDLKTSGIQRIILWGGVQATNELAVNYYTRNGFQGLGEFHHNGLQNYDMVLIIS